jgi:hypothetical protein
MLMWHGGRDIIAALADGVAAEAEVEVERGGGMLQGVGDPLVNRDLVVVIVVTSHRNAERAEWHGGGAGGWTAAAGEEGAGDGVLEGRRIGGVVGRAP